MTPTEREAVAELLNRSVNARQTGMSSAWGALIDAEKRVRALLAAPVTEPASVAELREAIEAERAVGTFSYADKDAARARADSILARLDVSGPVARCAACPIRARAGEPCAHDVEDCAAYGGPTVTEPVAQPGEADEESAAREDIVAALVAALARARGALYSVKFGTSTASELDATIDATSWDAIRAKKGAGS